MNLGTNTEYDRLRNALARIDSAILATFIADLAVQHVTVFEAAELLSRRGNSEAVFKAIKTRLRGLRRGKRFYHYREAPELERKLSVLLESMRRDLLPNAPEQAMEAAGLFLEVDASVMERVDDSSGGMGMVFREACELFAQAAEAAGKPPEAATWFFRLAEENAYGVRDGIFDHAARILQEKRLYELVSEWRRLLSEGENDKLSSLRARLGQVAKSLGDPVLYEETCLGEGSPDQYPRMALNVARFYLECGRPRDALAKIPAFDEASAHWEYNPLLADIFQALGDNESLAKIRFRQFRESGSAKAAKTYLETLPRERRKAERERLESIVLEGDFKPLVKAHFFSEMGKLEVAAAIIEAHAQSLGERNYYRLSELTKLLMKEYPRAATILYRAAAEETLTEAKSKNYHHAVQYIRKLEKLAGTIRSWDSIPSHEAWFDYIRERHKRKSAFWKAWNNH